jgi:hypothetical protein
MMLILIMIPVLIYLDATHHRIGEVPADETSASALTWALWTMIPFLGLVLACGYLSDRRELIQQAQRHPVVVPSARQNLTCLLVLAASMGAYWLVYCAGIYPHHPEPFNQHNVIDDDG